MKKKKLFGIVIFIVAIASVYFDAMSDGIRNYDSTRSIWHLYKATGLLLYAITFMLMVYQTTFYYFNIKTNLRLFFRDLVNCLAYIMLLRFALFDYIHNWYFKVNMMYVGNSATLDIFYNKLVAFWFPPSALFTLKIAIFVFLFFKITMIIDE